MRTTIRLFLVLLLLCEPATLKAQFNYSINSDGATVTITGYTGAGGVVTIPAIVDVRFAVTAIGEWAFGYNDSITSVIMPSSVTAVGEGAFASSSLSNITILDSVTNIGVSAFSQSRLSSITIPASVVYLGGGAFGACNSLTEVTILDGLTSILDYEFASCPLSNITVPASVTSIAPAAFADCGDMIGIFFLTNAPIVVPPSMLTEPGAFQGDDKLTAYYLPGSTGWDTFSASAGIPAMPWNPRIQSGSSFGVEGGQFGFDITGTANIPIVIESCTNLDNPVWVPIQSVGLTNGLIHFSEPFQTNNAGRFFRIAAP